MYLLTLEMRVQKFKHHQKVVLNGAVCGISLKSGNSEAWNAFKYDCFILKPFNAGILSTGTLELVLLHTFLRNNSSTHEDFMLKFFSWMLRIRSLFNPDPGIMPVPGFACSSFRVFLVSSNLLVNWQCQIACRSEWAFFFFFFMVPWDGLESCAGCIYLLGLVLLPE